MAEVGIDLRIKGNEIVFVYRTKQYQIRSHPSEPCTFICEGDKVLHTLHSGFETSVIMKMIMKDKSFASSNGHLIGYEMIREIFAATIDSGRPDMDFSLAEDLAVNRRDKRMANFERIENLYHEERKRKKEEAKVVRPVNSPKDGRAAEKSNTFIFRGETERDFYLVFSQAHDFEEYTHDRHEDSAPQGPPLGYILVAKDYESDWIAYRKYYLGWFVVVAPVASRFLKGFSDPHWKVIKDNTHNEMNKYVIFERPDGSICGKTCMTELDIADSMEEYQKMSEEEISEMCYSSE